MPILTTIRWNRRPGQADAQNDGEALDYYERALYLYPNDIIAREKMIEIYEKQKNTDAAMVLLIEIIKLDPANEDAYRDLDRYL